MADRNYKITKVVVQLDPENPEETLVRASIFDLDNNEFVEPEEYRFNTSTTDPDSLLFETRSGDPIIWH